LSLFGLPEILFTVGVVGDGLSDTYLDWLSFMGGNPGLTYNTQVGYNKGDNLVPLVHNTKFDNGVVVSLHELDDSTNYKNTTGKTVYVIINIIAIDDAGTRACKVYSGPTADSKTGATLLFDSTKYIPDDAIWNASQEKITTFVLAIQNNHFVNIENTSGATPRNLAVQKEEKFQAMVIEPIA